MSRLVTLGLENPLEVLLLDVSEYPEYIGVREDKTAYSGSHVLSILGNGNKAVYELGGLPTELYVGFAYRAYATPTSTPFFMVCNTSPLNWNNYLSINTGGFGGTVYVTRNNTTLATSSSGVFPTAGVWAYFEAWFKPLNSGGRITVKVNGSTVIDYTGDTTASGEYVSAFALRMGANNVTADVQFDDVVINDTSGSANNSWPGIIHLLEINPKAAGNNTDFTRAGVDMGANHDQVATGDPDSWVEGVADDYDLYSVPAPDLPAGATVKNVVVQTLAKSTSGASYVRPMVRSGTTNGEAAASIALPTDWGIQQATFAVNPDDSAAWEDTDFASLEIGAKIKSS